MFQIPDAVRSYWETKGYRKAVSADLAEVERLFGTLLPASYRGFVTQIGFVVFDDVPKLQMHDVFTYRIGSPEGAKIGQGDIAFFFEPEEIVKVHRICTNRQAVSEKDENFPKFPANYLPIGSDAGEGTILMEMGAHPGRIWFWPFNDWAWGTEDNTWLGFVADDFKDFINGLRP